MTAKDKLEQLYAIKDKLHPLTLIVVVGLVEIQNRTLGPHDETFIEEIYPMYEKVILENV